MNPLLTRQLRRHLGVSSLADLRRLVTEASAGGDADATPSEKQVINKIAAFVGSVEDAYQQYDRDVELRSRSLDLTSNELQDSNLRLREEVRTRQQTLEALLESANTLRADAGLAPLDPSGQVEASTLRDMMAGLLRQRKESAQQQQLAARVFAATNEGITITDERGNIILVNPAFSRITGYSASEIIGKNPRILHSGRQSPEFYRDLWASITHTGTWSGEIWNRRKNGEIYPEWLSINAVRDDSGKTTHYVAVFTDITTIKASQDHIAFLAHHDPLTALPNRILFNDRLEHSIQRAFRQDNRLGVLFIDLDHFKDVNDTLGHQAGDELLTQVARRFSGKVRANDTLARLGGDEFILLVDSADGPNSVAMIGEKLLNTLRQPFEIHGHKIHVGASIGISLYPDDGDTAEALVKNADAAMYQAKAHGRNNFHFYTQSMTANALARLELEGLLRNAIEGDALELHYQPQFDMRTRRLIGAEALLRWNHPTLGWIPPARFIPLAEETGTILPLGDWVLHEACRQVQQWEVRGLILPRIAVNLSSKQFDHGRLVETVRDALAAARIHPSRLELELTESLLMESGDAFPILEELRGMGVSLAIDDFGTGYSSLSYLKHLPVDKLKIDRSFVIDIGRDASDEVIVRTIIQLARSLALDVLAEGVENEQQERFLCNSGCDIAQGFLFSAALPPDNFLARFGT